MPQAVATFPTQTIDLSVVIVSWNTRDYLTRCLRSVSDEAKRARLSTEIIVVDNASRDGSADAVRNGFPDVVLLPLESNRGFAAATNEGIRRGSGRDVLLLNPDTELQHGSLEVLQRTLHAMPHVGLVSGLLLNPDGSRQSSGYRFPGLVQTFLDFFPLHPRLIASGLNGRVSPGDGITPYEVDHPLGACMLARHEVIERVGLLDECYFMYSEEIDWCQRLHQAGWTILVAPQARIIHFGGQSTKQAPAEMFLQLHRSRARYFGRYASPTFLTRAARLARVAGVLADRRGGWHSRDGDAYRTVAGIYEEARAGDN